MFLLALQAPGEIIVDWAYRATSVNAGITIGPSEWIEDWTSDESSSLLPFSSDIEMLVGNDELFGYGRATQQSLVNPEAVAFIDAQGAAYACSELINPDLYDGSAAKGGGSSWLETQFELGEYYYYTLNVDFDVFPGQTAEDTIGVVNMFGFDFGTIVEYQAPAGESHVVGSGVLPPGAYFLQVAASAGTYLTMPPLGVDAANSDWSMVLTMTAVPEASSVSLLSLLAILSLGRVRRRAQAL